MDFDNVVTVKSRTGKDVEFTYDGLPNVVDAKKGKKLPRLVAELAVSQNALRWDSGSGLPTDSLLYIVEDEGELALPSTTLSQSDIDDVKGTDGLGEDSIIIDGTVVKKKKINLKPRKEDFSANNLA